MIGRLGEAHFVIFHVFGRLGEAQSVVFYVSGRLWEAQFVVFYVSGRLWEGQSIVFYVSGRVWEVLGGRGAQSVVFHVVFGNFRSKVIKKHVFIVPSESVGSESTINTCFLITFERNLAKNT